MKSEIFAGLSLMPEDKFRASTYPLFEEGLVDWVEWTVDMGWSQKGIPDWLSGLLNFYGEEGRLSGHGVNYSALSAEWTQDQEYWLEDLKVEFQERKYVHMSEHFGYARAGEYEFNAPMPIPFCLEALETGRRNLARIAAIANVPVGLENLALAFGMDDVKTQGAFLDALVAPIDGFIVLDLHNLYCQSINFDIPVLELMRLYPLDRVLEMHISGGSTSESKHGYAKKPIRRDTHDGPVPNDLYELLPQALALCPNVQVVILERLGHTFGEHDVAKSFADEFRKLKIVIDQFNSNNATAGSADQLHHHHKTGSVSAEETQIQPLSNTNGLQTLQGQLLTLLADERNADWVKSELQRETQFSSFSEYLNSMEPRMIEVGQELIRKWGVKRKF